ncbi:EamA family transporter [Larkinella terrae]|uniref:EamA family transporter n=1 Tax=Larkinella terrae TaxID=2025311 RepID=A0A7K0EMF8_9BACT|nr:EamA family transporter [Larkinella terrae]MRS62994.1 EamA family transporter [Larkinella terrae]
MKEQPKPILVFLAFAAIYIIWGSTYLAALFGLATIPPFLMSGMRFFTAGVLLFGWNLTQGKINLTAQVLGRNALSGILMLFGGTVSVIWAEQHIPSGLAAILVTSLPFWFVLLDRRQWPTYFSNWMIPLGLVIGFAGVVLLVIQPGKTASALPSTGKFWISVAVLLVGGIFWTLGSLYAKYKPSSSSTLLNGSLQLISAGLFCGLVSLIAGELSGFELARVTTKSWLGLIYMIVMGSIITYLAYLWLLKVRPPAIVSTYAYVNPVIAVLLGWLFANESISGRQLVALAVILMGVLLVNLPNYKGIQKPVRAKP